MAARVWSCCPSEAEARLYYVTPPLGGERIWVHCAEGARPGPDVGKHDGVALSTERRDTEREARAATRNQAYSYARYSSICPHGQPLADWWVAADS
jgi:hypothetical protein